MVDYSRRGKSDSTHRLDDSNHARKPVSFLSLTLISWRRVQNTLIFDAARQGCATARLSEV